MTGKANYLVAVLSATIVICLINGFQTGEWRLEIAASLLTLLLMLAIGFVWVTLGEAIEAAKEGK